MHKTAQDFAMKYKIRLGKWVECKDDLYFIMDARGHVIEVSNYPTAKSAIVMMKRFLKCKNHT